MVRTHKIRLEPSNKQRGYFVRASGTARFAYNWGLAEWKKQYESGEKPNQRSLGKQLNSIKRDQFSWMMEVTKNAPQMALINLGNAFDKFFKGKAKYPKFKKKGIHDSFQLTFDQSEIDGKYLWVPKLGWVKLKEDLRFEGKVLTITISRRTDRWYASIPVEIKDTPRIENENQVSVVGIDLGVSTLATLSTGEKFIGPKPHKVLLSRLRRKSKSLSRKKKGSENREKVKIELSRLHIRISDIRKDFLHKLISMSKEC
jgi:putative transposase